MAGKCKEMNKIKQALRLHLDGESNRSIGRKLDLYKGTVNKYINMAESCGIPIPVLLTMEEPEIERVLTEKYLEQFPEYEKTFQVFWVKPDDGARFVD